MIYDLDIQKEVKTANISLTSTGGRYYRSHSEIYRDSGIFALFRSFYSPHYICKGNLSTLIDKINNNIIKKENINQSATLYFDKACTFPRYKLQDTNFKRCVKLDKADYIVIPKLPNTFASAFKELWTREFEHNNIVYRCNSDIDNLLNSVDKEKYNPYTITNDDYVYADNKKIGEFIYNVLHNYNKPFIREDDLDKLISKNNLEKLDYDSLMSLYEMLDSTDQDSIELGCKLLTTFDIFDKRLSVSFVLFITQDHWINNKGSKSSTFKTSLNSLNYPHTGYYSIEQMFNNQNMTSEEDKEVAKKFVDPWLRKEINRTMHNVLERCPYKISLNITVE